MTPEMDPPSARCGRKRNGMITKRCGNRKGPRADPLGPRGPFKGTLRVQSKKTGPSKGPWGRESEIDSVDRMNFYDWLKFWTKLLESGRRGCWPRGEEDLM